MNSDTDIAFFLTPEQKEIESTLDRFLADRWPLDDRRQRDWPADRLWHELGEMGILSLSLPESSGGLGGGMLDIMLVAQALGAHLVDVPYVSSAVIPGILIAGGDEALAGVASGSRRYAVAMNIGGEWQSGSKLAVYEEAGNGFSLDASAVIVTGFVQADRILVPARHRRQPERISLFSLLPSQTGLDIVSEIALNGRTASRASLIGVEVGASALVGAEGAMLPAVRATSDMLLLYIAAETIGIAKALFDRTVAYVKVRKQFGATIGSFQAVQHRLVEMFTAIETASAQVQSAFAQFDHVSPEDRQNLALVTKMHVDEAAHNVARETVQLHGGMGLTAELDVGCFFKHLLVLRMIDGGPKAQARQIAGLRSPPTRVQSLKMDDRPAV